MNASGNCVCTGNTPNWNATTGQCEGPGNGTRNGTGTGGGSWPTSWPEPRIIEGEPGELVDIEYFYDVGGESIFAPPLAEGEEPDPLTTLYSTYNDLGYGNSGGIVRDGDIEDLIEYLRGKNGNNT
tara:strand:+ start:222 stop:599 length:378 start_codon:yes stop_codon:yes gene_type:complete